MGGDVIIFVVIGCIFVTLITVGIIFRKNIAKAFNSTGSSSGDSGGDYGPLGNLQQTLGPAGAPPLSSTINPDQGCVGQWNTAATGVIDSGGLCSQQCTVVDAAGNPQSGVLQYRFNVTTGSSGRGQTCLDLAQATAPPGVTVVNIGTSSAPNIVGNGGACNTDLLCDQNCRKGQYAAVGGARPNCTSGLTQVEASFQPGSVTGVDLNAPTVSAAITCSDIVSEALVNRTESATDPACPQVVPFKGGRPGSITFNYAPTQADFLPAYTSNIVDCTGPTSTYQTTTLNGLPGQTTTHWTNNPWGASPCGDIGSGTVKYLSRATPPQWQPTVGQGTGHYIPVIGTDVTTGTHLIRWQKDEDIWQCQEGWILDRSGDRNAARDSRSDPSQKQTISDQGFCRPDPTYWDCGDAQYKGAVGKVGTARRGGTAASSDSTIQMTLDNASGVYLRGCISKIPTGYFPTSGYEHGGRPVPGFEYGAAQCMSGQLDNNGRCA